MNFEFATAGQIHFGRGRRHELHSAARKIGTRAVLVTGGNSGRAEWARAGLREKGMAVEIFTIPAEPTLRRVEEGRRLARAFEADLIVAIGGGSAIDAGKAVAALATNEGEVAYYLEIIGGGKPLADPPLPLIALPTTAGTGSEVTRNSVLLSPEHQLKVSLRSPMMLPTLAIVDPELTYDLPRELTASTGMDALTQLIEAFVSAKANAIVDGFCREAIPRVIRALPLACHDGGTREAREEMALGSLFGGLALANAGLGAVHGFAAPIGGMFEAPHGAVCAALLPIVLEVNHRALTERGREHSALARFEELGRLLAGQRHAGANQAIEVVRDLTRTLGIRGLSAYRVEKSQVPLLCSRAAQASSMRANPLQLRAEELDEILTRAL